MSHANPADCHNGLELCQEMPRHGVTRPDSLQPRRATLRCWSARRHDIEAEWRIPRMTGSGSSLPSSTPRLRPIHCPAGSLRVPRLKPTNFPSVQATAYSIGAGTTQSCTAALTLPRSSKPTTRSCMPSMIRSTRQVPSGRDRVVAITSNVRRSRTMILPMAGWFNIRNRPSGASGSLDTGALPARKPRPAHLLPVEHLTRAISRPFTATSHPLAER